MWRKMRKSLGSKRRELGEEYTEEITRLFGTWQEAQRDSAPISGPFRTTELGYRTITVECPLRDEQGEIVRATKGKAKGTPLPETSLRDTEDVPRNRDVEEYFRRGVLPHARDAWIAHEQTKVGYEIPFNRHFYVFKPPRPLRFTVMGVLHVLLRWRFRGHLAASGHPAGWRRPIIRHSVCTKPLSRPSPGSRSRWSAPGPLSTSPAVQVQSTRSSTGVALGSQRVKHDPSPLVLRSVRSPPIRFASSSPMDSPRPAPPCLRVFPGSACTNG